GLAEREQPRAHDVSRMTAPSQPPAGLSNQRRSGVEERLHAFSENFVGVVHGTQAEGAVKQEHTVGGRPPWGARVNRVPVEMTGDVEVLRRRVLVCRHGHAKADIPEMLQRIIAGQELGVITSEGAVARRERFGCESRETK